MWRDIILRRTFWKIVFERNGIDWESIPNHIKENERSWIIFYAACKNRIFERNFILNHSGHRKCVKSLKDQTKVLLLDQFSVPVQFNHWQKLQDNADRIIVETPPVGIEPLPADPRYSSMVDSAFVFSYDWGALQQKVNLKDVGLTKDVMRSIMPFQFVATQWLAGKKIIHSKIINFRFLSSIGTRFDCGGCFCVVLCLLDQRGEAILFNMSDNIIPAGENWIEATCTLNVIDGFERFDDIKSLAIVICGKDTQYWAGHYGTKCSRIAVNLKCLSRIEAKSVAPHSKYVTNPQNAHVFIGSFWQNLLPNRTMGRCPYSRPPRR